MHSSFHSLRSSSGMWSICFRDAAVTTEQNFGVVDRHHPRSMKALQMAEDDENLDSKIDETKGFDGEGLTSYLLP